MAVDLPEPNRQPHEDDRGQHRVDVAGPVAHIEQSAPHPSLGACPQGVGELRHRAGASRAGGGRLGHRRATDCLFQQVLLRQRIPERPLVDRQITAVGDVAVGGAGHFVTVHDQRGDLEVLEPIEVGAERRDLRLDHRV